MNFYLFLLASAFFSISNQQDADSYLIGPVRNKLDSSLASAAQISEASKTWSYNVLADSNGISHYVFIKKASQHLLLFTRALHKQFSMSRTWRRALVECASMISYFHSLLTRLQTVITDMKYFSYGFPNSQIFKMFEDLMEIIDFSQQLEDHLLREAFLGDLNMVFNHLQRLVEQTDRYAPVVRSATDVITLFFESELRMLNHQRGCAKSDGRLLRSNVQSQEVVVLLNSNSSAASWNNVIYYGQPVAIMNPSCDCYLTNADFDCYGTMAWDQNSVKSNEYFRFLHPDLSVSLARPLRIGDRVVVQSTRDKRFICPASDPPGAAVLKPKSTRCEFQVRFRTTQIPQI